MIAEIHALVLTYNRRELVLRCIQALVAQSRPFASIIIVDNGSSDGTQAAIEALRNPLIDYVRIENNLGARSTRCRMRRSKFDFRATNAT